MLIKDKMNLLLYQNVLILKKLKKMNLKNLLKKQNGYKKIKIGKIINFNFQVKYYR
jgi:hypothetical protein